MESNERPAAAQMSLFKETLKAMITVAVSPRRGFEYVRDHPRRVALGLMMMVFVTVPYYVAYIPGYFFVKSSGVAVGWVTIWQRVVPFHSIYGFFCVTFPWYYVATLALVGLFLVLGLFVRGDRKYRIDGGSVFVIVVFATQVPAMLDGLVYEQFFVYYQLFTGATQTPDWYYYILASLMLIMLVWVTPLYYLGFKTLYRSSSSLYAVFSAVTTFLLHLVMNWLWWGKIPLSFYQQ